MCVGLVCGNRADSGRSGHNLAGGAMLVVDVQSCEILTAMMETTAKR
jgi:hypothetical protein